MVVYRHHRMHHVEMFDLHLQIVLDHEIQILKKRPKKTAIFTHKCSVQFHVTCKRIPFSVFFYIFPHDKILIFHEMCQKKLK